MRWQGPHVTLVPTIISGRPDARDLLYADSAEVSQAPISTLVTQIAILAKIATMRSCLLINVP